MCSERHLAAALLPISSASSGSSKYWMAFSLISLGSRKVSTSRGPKYMWMDGRRSERRRPPDPATSNTLMFGASASTSDGWCTSRFTVASFIART